ncbi:MAG: hypothetical protein H0X38_13625 [Planctomycetes bacterium]|nr:hypothetical protein [Planctomycetota bacterium]
MSRATPSHLALACAAALAATCMLRATAADPAAALAAWSPLAADREQVVADENLPLVENRIAPYLQGWVLGAPRRRLAGGVVRTRQGSLADAEAVLGYADTQHGWDAGMFGPSCFRRCIYLRAGTDPLAERAGRAVAAVGGDLLGSLAGGPIGVWGEVGHSSERGIITHIEGMLLIVHASYDGEETVHSARAGLCLRWPGGPLARTVQADPWSFALAIDHQNTTTAGRTIGGAAVTLESTWRFGDHLLLSAQADAMTNAVHADGSTAPAASVTMALGVTF